MDLLVEGGAGRAVEFVENALRAVEFCLEPDALVLLGAAERAEEGLGLGEGLGPDGPVAGVVGGLRAGAESHIPARGLVAFGVSASFRHRALPGSANQQEFAVPRCRVPARLARRLRRSWSLDRTWGEAAACRVSSSSAWVKKSISPRAPGSLGMMPYWLL
ncbi:hypothetical protein ACFC1L_41340 [Streptomyces sp. NPDC056210]|uniref:hypothetical protein n=1 Tax=Streptomyces sp. NPDC056210 TaxID=3345746 RepID=UPI0035E37523